MTSYNDRKQCCQVMKLFMYLHISPLLEMGPTDPPTALLAIPRRQQLSQMSQGMPRHHRRVSFSVGGRRHIQSLVPLAQEVGTPFISTRASANGQFISCWAACCAAATAVT